MKKIQLDLENTRKFLKPYELKPHIISFTQQLSNKGYTHLSAKSYADSISHLGTWLNKKGILLKDVNSETIKFFAEHSCSYPGTRRMPSISIKYVNRVQQFLSYLHQKGFLRHSFRASINVLPNSIVQFSEFLNNRGLSPKTISRYTHSINVTLPLLGSNELV